MNIFLRIWLQRMADDIVDRIEGAIVPQLQQLEARMAALDDRIAELTADAEAERNAVVAAEGLLTQLFSMIQAALNQATTDAGRVTAVQAIIDKVVPDTTTLAASIVSNTPAATPPAPGPAPTPPPTSRRDTL
jgi:hypothetical protein